MDFHRSSKHVSSFRVLLKTLQRYPGDMLRGVVEITVNAPLKYTLLEAHLRGEEVTRFGTAFTKRIDTESRYTTYYRQRVILAGLLPPSDEQRGSEKSSSGHWSDAGVSVTDSAEIGPNIVTMGLMPGTYTFPFSVRLPETLPPSYSDHHGSGYSKLLYSIKAKLYSGSRSLVKDRVYFVVCMLPVNPRQWVTVHKSLESGTIASIAGGSREGSALQDTLEMQGMGDRQAEQEDRDMLYREESEYLAGGNFLLIEHRIPLYNANVNVDGINANNGLDVADDDTTPLDHAVDLVKLSRRQRKEKEHEEKERRRMEKRKKKEQEKMRKRKQEQGMKEAGGGGEEEAPEVGDKSKKGQEKKLSEPSKKKPLRWGIRVRRGRKRS
ncbi:hypothetical protein DQ04_06041050 [Trypanosoma grayi]|uniref:hypothetical protein n=1 Tax=Trypanosoma grayi TaxID=71804 RepID=UPI0004F45CF6|nr:hypothetical protein DQ04_06041050 [Trypanosoma grayi]KEG08991.1 hypothetical protein DQ04_06041050 [Trypanosoma grayi]